MNTNEQKVTVTIDREAGKSKIDIESNGENAITF